MQDLIDDVLLASFIEVVSAVVAEQGVEIHQWLRDEKYRKAQEEQAL